MRPVYLCILLLYFQYKIEADNPKTKLYGIGNTIEQARRYGAKSTNRTLDTAGRGGDIKLTEEQLQFLFPDKYEQKNRTKRAGSLKSIRYWENGIVPYVIERMDFNREEYDELTAAMRVYEAQTCIKFVPATSQNVNYLWFHHTDDGCYSFLGNIRIGKQEVSLQRVGCRHFGTYLHEIGHALGMIHEHQRPDRNQFVHYYMANVDPNNEDQLDLYDLQATRLFSNIPYDLGSIMHYELDSFSIDDVSPTLGVDNPWLAKFVGRRYSNQLSYGDVLLLNKVYQCGIKCSGRCPTGFINKRCECITQEIYQKDSCKNDVSMVEWCYDLVQKGHCDVENIEHHRMCARACDFCPRFKLGQSAIFPKTPTKTEMKTLCFDQYVYPALCAKWAGAGRCQSPWMQRYCRRSCNACRSGIGDCPNMYDDKLCDSYARSGMCERVGDEGDFVRNKCKDSCGICMQREHGRCNNRIPDHTCATMDNQRKCELQPLAMFQSCPKTCNRCYFNAGNCVNKADDKWCSIQAMKNMCFAGKNVDEIRAKCPKACNHCGPSERRILGLFKY